MINDELKEHTKCDTPDCCGECETASKVFEVPIDINIYKTEQQGSNNEKL